MLRTLVLALVAWVAWVAKDAGSPHGGLWEALASPFRKAPWQWSFYLALALLALEFAERSITVLQFRAEKIQAILDQMVKEMLSSRPKDHRCSLLREASGFRVTQILLGRALRQDSTWFHIRGAFLVPWGRYLYVWSRAKGSNNGRSCAAFRVYSSPKREVDGIAGLVWSKDEAIVSGLTPPDPRLCDTLKGWDEVVAIPLLKKYAAATHIRSLRQLKARDRFARHFYGAVIEGGKHSRKWGVLLIDSTDLQSPWPGNKGAGKEKRRQFDNDFQSFRNTFAALLT